MDKSQTIVERLVRLREEMQREHLDAVIIPTTDPHNSEYTADHWKGREWMSGFNGSAGTAVITLTGAALWTDSRYFLAAEEQLQGTGYVLMKEKVSGTPTIAEWLATQQVENVAIDGSVVSASTVRKLQQELRQHGGMTLRTNWDPLERVWSERPAIPASPVSIHPLEYAGEATHDKLQRIRKALREVHADGMLVASLDDIAWTLNLRGQDVHCTPVFVSYLLISTQKVILFINKEKLSQEVQAYLKAEDIGVDDYANVGKGLKDYFEYNILMDPDEVNATLFSKATCKVVEAASPIPVLKAVKNEREIVGFRQAMLRDGIAMVKFLKWLRPAVEAGGQTEMTVAEKLRELRSEQPLYRDLSFDTIAGYQSHGAIVHYEVTPETDVPLRPEGLLLIDSGAHYEDGTTDITRTIALGPVTEEQKHVCTLVLKGHIQLAMARFPQGTCGTQLDVLARQAMWRERLNYLHGTGHGVGSYLCVHEGPHQIRMNHISQPLLPGMTVTDEPGLYLAGKFGVRTENVLLVKESGEGEYGPFLDFEVLTLCPIDTTPIDFRMLTQEETDWLNRYHQHVYDQLASHLDEEERAWLRAATNEI
jgi:Xaa-Pro aminopeptidase